MAPPKPSRGGFSLFGIGGGGGGGYTQPKDLDIAPPSLTLQTDKNVYRPGDPVEITIQIQNPVVDEGFSLLIERLSFEAKGIEKLDTQWFTTQKSSSSDSKQRKRGEYVFMDCSVPSLVSNQILSSGTTKTYMLRMILPSIIPPSYKGSTVRYLYYVRSMIFGQYLILENGHLNGQSLRRFAELEARSPLQIWVTEKTNGLLNEGGTEGIVPASTFLLDVYWKEMDAESEWARANETFEGMEEGYESSKDEISSVSSYNLARGSLQKAFGSSLSLQSSAARSGKDTHYPEHRPSISSSYMALPRLSVAEVYYDSSGDILSPKKSSAIVSPSEQLHTKSLLMDDELRLSIPRMVEPVASEGFVRGRSYNIRLDDQVLLRFSPKKPESTFYFSDMIGGTLTFFHEEGVRRCLELSITLELSETISHRSLHPSRRHSPTITKLCLHMTEILSQEGVRRGRGKRQLTWRELGEVIERDSRGRHTTVDLESWTEWRNAINVYSDHHEVVADLVQTSFLFSIPMDGPMSFSTRHVSVQWMLRFEFFTTPKNVDWTRLEHPLLVDGRDKCEWVLSVNVHAPPVGASSSHSRTEKPQSLQPLWVHA